ncbi:MAG TPA: hypothetical protein VJ826_03990 [Candidatus Polarisedimenticolaceae bacterium]|nr:hypothetical protein [Candidatus Polarisedimenticolaceae bacterium]
MMTLLLAATVTLVAPPAPVVEALHKRFPGATIEKWSKENEHGVVLYDVEFLQDGHKLEADVKQDGTIDNWEREIPESELPEAARAGALAAHPGAKILQVMACTRVAGGRDELEGYEILLQPPKGKKAEVTVAPDGKVLEDGDDD